NITSRKITNAPVYTSNYTLYTDLHLKTVQKDAKMYYKRFHSCLNSHSNLLIQSLATSANPSNSSSAIS
ncbi:Uncharacterized protein FWK35_00000854, partial [Aphis craccivora]